MSRPGDHGGRVRAHARAARGCYLLRQALLAACELIWNEDAAYVEGGPERLDAWVERYGPLVGFDGPERASQPEAGRAPKDCA